MVLCDDVAIVDVVGVMIVVGVVVGGGNAVTDGVVTYAGCLVGVVVWGL